MAGFFTRWRKYSKLHAMSRRLGIRGPQDTLPAGSIENWLKQGDERKQAEQDLYNMVLSDHHCIAVIAKHGANRETLASLYGALLRAGAGQWAGASWIPCFALAEPWTLDFLLRKQAVGGIQTEEAFRIVTFYQDDLSLAWLTAEPPLAAREQYRRRRN
jgi:hypothetical protein